MLQIQLRPLQLVAILIGAQVITEHLTGFQVVGEVLQSIHKVLADGGRQRTHFVYIQYRPVVQAYIVHDDQKEEEIGDEQLHPTAYTHCHGCNNKIIQGVTH